MGVDLKQSYYLNQIIDRIIYSNFS